MKNRIKILILALGIFLPTAPAFSFEEPHQEKFAAYSKKKKKKKRKKSRRSKRKRSKKRKKKKSKEESVPKDRSLRFYIGSMGGLGFNFASLTGIGTIGAFPTPMSIAHNHYFGIYLIDMLRAEVHFVHRLSASGTSTPSIKDENGEDAGTSNIELSLSSMSITGDFLLDVNIAKSPVDLYFGAGAGVNIATLGEFKETRSTGIVSSMGASAMGFALKGSLGIAFNVHKNIIIDVRGDIFLLGPLQTATELTENAYPGKLAAPLTGSHMPVDVKLGIRAIF